MDQTVMSFAGTAARGSAIPSPVEGMYTHLEDTDTLQFWNGSAWTLAATATGAGLVFITSQTVSSATSIIFNNSFSSAFNSYKIFIQGVTANRGFINARLRVGGVDAAGSNYINAMIFRDSVSLSSVYGASTVLQTAYSENLTGNTSIEITDPFRTRATSFASTSGNIGSTGANTWILGGGHQPTNSYDGITFLPEHAFTGTISIYGVRV
jgi:hypothetical protein